MRTISYYKCDGCIVHGSAYGKLPCESCLWGRLQAYQVIMLGQVSKLCAGLITVTGLVCNYIIIRRLMLWLRMIVTSRQIDLLMCKFGRMTPSLEPHPKGYRCPRACLCGRSRKHSCYVTPGSMVQCLIHRVVNQLFEPNCFAQVYATSIFVRRPSQASSFCSIVELLSTSLISANALIPKHLSSWGYILVEIAVLPHIKTSKTLWSNQALI